MTQIVTLSALDLGLAAGLVLLLALLTTRFGMKLAGSMALSATRAALQLLLIGLVLEALFAHSHLLWVGGIGLVMLLVAGREVMARQTRRFRGGWGFGLGTVSMFLSSFAVAILALLVLVQPEPWYAPQYAIPLLGMLLGNTMNGIALALERLTDAAWDQRRLIEARLALGHPWQAAIDRARRESARSGLIPIINAMAAAGVVSLPGMMTGQILAGAPPMEAVKYQILIFFLIALGTGFGTLAAVWMAARRLFDDRQRLRLDRLTSR